MRKKKEQIKDLTPVNDLEIGEWRVHTVNMLKEVFNNDKMGIFKIPFNVFGKILYEVGEAAARINDPILNGLMCRLTIYEIADPESPDYDYEEYKRVMVEYQKAKKKLKTRKLTNDTKSK